MRPFPTWQLLWLLPLLTWLTWAGRAAKRQRRGWGGGAIGLNARGGDGGAGGEQVSARIDLAEPRNAGLDRIQGIVGQGGSGSHVPGRRGDDGQDTFVNFLGEDRSFPKSLRATGGSGGRSGASYLPEDTVALSSEDIKGGFRITALMAVNAAELRESLLHILGGGWHRFFVSHIPCQAVWTVVCSARWRSLKGNRPRGMFLSLLDPAGREIFCETLFIPAEGEQLGDRHWTRTIGASLDAERTWTLRLHSGEFPLAGTDFQVAVAP
jgi:hypothetical protein